MKVILTVPPSPPHLDIYRSFAGGFGTAGKVQRSKYGHSTTPFPPIELAVAASSLKNKDQDAEIIDGQALRLDKESYIQQVSRKQPEIIISSLSLPSINNDLGILKDISISLPGTVFLTTGTTPRYLAADILRQGVGVIHTEIESFAYLNDPSLLVENTDNTDGLEGALMPNQMKQIIQDGVPLPYQPLVEMDKLPLPDLDLLPLDRYKTKRFDGEEKRFLISYGSKGCPYNCTYCPYPVGHGTRPRMKSATRILEEIDHATRHGVDGIFFRDQDFLIDKKRLSEFSEGMRQRKTDLVWECETRVDRLNHETVKTIAEAGCRRINLGVETGDPKLFETEGKPGVRFETISKAFRILRETGINSRAFIMIGLPGETWTTVEHTKTLVENLGTDAIQVAILTPYPGTPLYHKFKEEGYRFPGWENFTGFDPVTPTTKMSRNDLEMARQLILTTFRKTRRQADIKNAKQKGDIIGLISTIPKYIRTEIKLRYLQTTNRKMNDQSDQPVPQ